MTDAPSPLPDFEHPPVSEVVLSVGFLDLPQFHVGLIGRYWAMVSDDFPTVEQQPRYEMPIEPLVESPVAEPPAVQLLEAPPIPRVWLRNTNGDQLIQLQSDWFAFNWRNAGGTAEYPRYPAVEEQFFTHLRKLVRFFEEHRVGDVGITQCEVTYINHIEPPPESGGGLHEILSLAARPGMFLPQPSHERFLAVYPLSTSSGDRCGRLHVTAQPGYRRPDNSPILALNLTARGFPLGGGEDGIMDFMRLGREWVVRGFAYVTTERMHEVWGRRA